MFKLSARPSLFSKTFESDKDVMMARLAIKEKTSGWFALTAALVFLVRLQFADLGHPVTAATGVICCLMFANYILIKSDLFGAHSGTLLIGTTAISLVSLAYISGGVTSPVVALFPLLPLMTSLLISRLAGWYTAAFLVATLSIFGVFNIHAFQLIYEPIPQLIVFWVVLATLLGSLIGHHFASENEALSLRLRDRAQLDFLTNIPNRRGIDTRMIEYCRYAERNGSWLTVMMMDIDHFKRYNDTNGHAAGDQCLKQVARALSYQLQRPLDFVGRYGGEEFTVILPDTNEQGAKHVAEGLRHAVEKLAMPYRPGGKRPVTITIGVVSMRGKTLVAEEAIKSADALLYDGKENGRNRVIAATLEVKSEGEGENDKSEAHPANEEA